MHLTRRNSAARLATAIAIVGALSVSGWAQNSQVSPQPAQPQAPQSQPFQLGDYSKGRSHFPNPVGPYVPRNVPPPTAADSAGFLQALKGTENTTNVSNELAS